MSEELSCKYCSQKVDKLKFPSLRCVACEKSVHLNCLRRNTTPGGIFGDVFFDFTCKNCTPNGDESFQRDKMPWFQAIVLALYDLLHKAEGSGRNGYFHWKIHIGSYIDKHWNFLFKKDFKRKKNWTGTVSGTLSLNSPVFFKSGTHLFGEGGWWKLQHSNLTPEIIVQIYNELILTKQKNKVKGRNHLEINSVPSINEQAIVDSIIEKFNYPKSVIIDAPIPKSEENPTKRAKYDSDDDIMLNFQPSDGVLDFLPMNDEIFTEPFDLDFEFSSSDFCEESNSSFTSRDIIDSDETKTDEKIEEKVEIPKSLFNTTNTTCKRPWEAELINREFTENKERLHPLTPTEENDLLSKLLQIDELPPKYQRLKAKLRLRKLKRSKNMKVFNIDNIYEELGSTMSTIPKNESPSHLDRYRSETILATPTSDLTNSTISFHEKLIGCGGGSELKPFLSPFTNRILKPYIRRDSETTQKLKPIWLKLMNELQVKCNVTDFREVGSIDYCYVRAEHIPAVNALCEQYFWCGINMSEALQYPDFSCVALYKKIVIGFAFMIPDVSYNESYISFIFTRPEWRRAGIATFMLYHLVQTCMGKEVTLHVSATNPAVILYQKFGFKVEEFIQGFYDKYIIDGRHECKHALFLRLAR